MSVSQIGLTTIRVTWNANWSNRFTTSHIYYQRLGTSTITSRSVDWWDNSTDIGGLMGGADYSIYIAHTASNPNTVRAAAKFTTGIYCNPLTECYTDCYYLFLLCIELAPMSITSSPSSPTVGHRVTLTCSLTLPTGVTGTPSFRWNGPSGNIYNFVQPYFTGRIVSHRLTLSQIAPSDVGEYTCTADLSGSVSTTTIIPSLQSKLI